MQIAQPDHDFNLIERIMHPLLQRQLKKYFPEGIEQGHAMQKLLLAIGQSYQNFDEKISMMQRATVISSEELNEAKEAITNEAQRQQLILTSLEKALNRLSTDENEGLQPKYRSAMNLDAEKITGQINSLINQIVAITEEKNGLLKNLEMQNESLNNYAHVVSHDLKSPIRNISTLVSWIAEEEQANISTTSKGNFQLIELNLNKMDRLIENILRHATIEKIEEENASVDLNQLLAEIQKTIFIPANVSIKICKALPVLYIQKYLFEQLFTNLIANSITATEHLEHGQIHIDFYENRQYWEFRCTDNGKGIAEKHRSSIFEMFNKLENDFKATGIGLALVKKIINLYQGNIWIESEEGKGTTFFFTIKK